MPRLLTRKQIRLKEYDYSQRGYYFITICSDNRKNIFSKYKNDVGAPLDCARNNIQLSEIGQIINTQWNNIKNNYDNVELDEYIIMPNHIHGILIISNRAEASTAPTISQIIRAFKSKSTMQYLKYINSHNLKISGKIWQRSFYEHIIRNEKSLNEIREYIQNNPLKWEEDKENPENI